MQTHFTGGGEGESGRIQRRSYLHTLRQYDCVESVLAALNVTAKIQRSPRYLVCRCEKLRVC
jgi:hypothetical protein